MLLDDIFYALFLNYLIFLKTLVMSSDSLSKLFLLFLINYSVSYLLNPNLLELWNPYLI